LKNLATLTGLTGLPSLENLALHRPDANAVIAHRPPGLADGHDPVGIKARPTSSPCHLADSTRTVGWIGEGSWRHGP
jgi:hypothetical protein